MMELPVLFQLRQLGLSLLLGAALGLFYDLLRAQRRVWRKLTPALDLFFSLGLLLSLWLFSLYVGEGRLRLFMLPAIAVGTALYFLTLSRVLLPLLILPFRGLRRAFGALFRATLRCFSLFRKKTAKICKKVLAIGKKSVIIDSKVLCKGKKKGGGRHAVQAHIHHGKASHPRRMHL